MGALRRWLSKAYYAGPELADAVDVCQRLSRQDLSATIGYWPDHDAAPKDVADAYLAGIARVAVQGLNSTISVKPMVMNFDRDLIAEITDRAASAGVGIHHDSRGIEFADPTFDLLAAFAGHKASIGCTLPGAWQRSPSDADRAVELGLNVRVVKGMWRDPEHPGINFREGYLAVIDRLCGRARHVGVATHDAWLAREALGRLVDSGTPCELEQLFGLPTRETLRVAQQLGVATRVYIPYGNSWLPYALSRAVRRPRMLLWLLRDAVFGRWSYRLK